MGTAPMVENGNLRGIRPLPDLTRVSAASFLWNPGKNGKIKVMEAFWGRVEKWFCGNLSHLKQQKMLPEAQIVR